MYQLPVPVGKLLLPLLLPTLFNALPKTSLILLIPKRRYGMLSMTLAHTKDLWIPALLLCGMKSIQITHESAQWGQEVTTQYFCRDWEFVSHLLLLPVYSKDYLGCQLGSVVRTYSDGCTIPLSLYL